MRTLLFVAVLGILMCSFASAWELNPFADKKIVEREVTGDMSDFIKEDFNVDYGVIRLSKTFLWIETDKIVEYSLSSNTKECLIDCEAIGKAVLYSDGTLFDDIIFKTSAGQEINIDSKYFIKVTEEYVEETPVYSKICREMTAEERKSHPDRMKEYCENKLNYTLKETKTRELWNEYKGEELKAGDYEWKVIGKKKPYQSVDFIPIKSDNELSEWAWWNGNWGKKRQMNITSYYFVYNVTYDSDMQADFDDIRFTNANEDVELNYSVDYVSDSSGAIFRVNALGGGTIYMYYGNPAASSNGDIQKVYGGNVEAAVFFNNYSGTTHTDSANTTRTWYAIGSPANARGKIYGGISVTSGNVLNSSTGYIAQGNAFTFLAWFNTTTIGDNYLYASNPPAGDFATMAFWSNKYYIYHNAGWDTGEAATTSVWKQYGYSYNGTTEVLYVDGTYEQSSAVGLTLSTDYGGTQTIGLTAFGATAKVSELLHIRRALSATEIYNIYNTSSSVTLGGEEAVTMVVVTLVAPSDYTNTTSHTIFFNSTASSPLANLTNATLTIWGDTIRTNTTTFPGTATSGGTNLTYYLPDGVYNWSYQYCGTNGSAVCEWASSNRTLTVDTSNPSVAINFPTSKYIGTNLSLHKLTYTISDLLIDACWYTNLTGSDNIIPCAGLSNFTFPDFGVDYSLKVYANDTMGNIGMTSVNITAVNTTGTQTAPASSMEGIVQNFTIYVNRSINVSITPTFVYNGTSYDSTLISTSGYNYRINITIPTLSGTTTPQINNYYWTFNMSFLSGTAQTARSDIKTISVSQVQFGPCDASLTLQVLNITFKDETSGNYMNATMDSSTWNYNISGVTKSFTFSNATHNPEYDFCISPSYISSSIIAGAELMYSSSQGGTYPSRKYVYNETLYNSTVINKTLFLLSDTHGINSNYQVITVGNQVVSGAHLTMQRLIGGTLTTVADGYTDDAGTISFFLNPNFEHTLTVSKEGYATQVNHIFPSLTTYTITLGGSSGYFNYSSPIAGMRYTKYPPSGILQNGMYNFTLEVYSRNNNIYNCSFYIKYLNGTTKASAFGCNESAPNQGGKISTMVNVTRIDRLYGQYYVGTANGTILLEGDARWVNVNVTSGGVGYYGSLMYALRDIITLPEWGGQCPDSYTLNETDMYCYNAAGAKVWNQTGDFSRIMFFFIFFAIILAALNFFTGYDTAYPGAFIYIMTGVVFILSVVNGVSGPGYFYLYGATNSSFFGSLSSIVNNWIVFVHFFMLTLIYFFTTNKRYQTG